jgi:hypothetical protein
VSELQRRLAADFVIIVVGVLVALGVDAAWEAREERVREAAYLRQLRVDLSATADTLVEMIKVDSLARASADRALEALNATPLPPSRWRPGSSQRPILRRRSTRPWAP